jgi:hypothetical protein
MDVERYAGPTLRQCPATHRAFTCRGFGGGPLIGAPRTPAPRGDRPARNTASRHRCGQCRRGGCWWFSCACPFRRGVERAAPGAAGVVAAEARAAGERLLGEAYSHGWSGVAPLFSSLGAASHLTRPTVRRAPLGWAERCPSLSRLGNANRQTRCGKGHTNRRHGLGRRGMTCPASSRWS